jgi:hypothetical protein
MRSFIVRLAILMPDILSLDPRAGGQGPKSQRESHVRRFKSLSLICRHLSSQQSREDG